MMLRSNVSPDLCRDPDDQRPVRYLHPLAYHAGSTDNTEITYIHVMKDRCVYADKDMIADTAAVEHRSMTDMSRKSGWA